MSVTVWRFFPRILASWSWVYFISSPGGLRPRPPRRREVLPEGVFDEGDLLGLVVDKRTGISANRRFGPPGGDARRRQGYLAGRFLAGDDRLDHALVLDGLGQPGEPLLIEILPGLVWGQV